jgi:hypothetical protein
MHHAGTVPYGENQALYQQTKSKAFLRFCIGRYTRLKHSFRMQLTKVKKKVSVVPEIFGRHEIFSMPA